MQIISLTGQGSGASVTATQSGGLINAVTIVSGGVNYINPPSVTVVGASGGTGAVLTATVVAGVITAIAITNAGTGYAGAITVTVTPAPGGIVLATATGALAPTAGQDISGLTTGSFTWCVEVVSLTAAKTMQLALELTVNAFGASVFADIKQFIGQLGQGGVAFAYNAYNPTSEKQSTVVKQQLPFAALNYFGVASARARANITGIDASAQAAINSWIEVG